MARNEKSRIDFNVNITGARDINTLVKQLPKLIDQFERLAEAQQKYESSTGKTSSSSTSIKKGDVSDRISRIELGVRQGDIDSVQQLHGHYGQLVRQLNKLERAGKNTGSIRLRAQKQHARLTKNIREETKAKRENLRATMNQSSGMAKSRRQLLDQQGAIELSTKQLRKASQQVGQTAQATTNASYLLLNAGYLIQDSPYGIRGMANNVSQLVQSYQMLHQRIQILNRTQGTNLSVTQQLMSLIKGPTGWILLVGSIMPAALEFLSQNWDSLTGSQEKGNEELERSIELFEKWLELKQEQEGFEGSDPLGIGDLKDQLENQREIAGIVSERIELEEDLKRAEDRLRDARSPQSGGTGREERIEKQKEAVKEAAEELKSFRDEWGGVADQDLEDVRDKIEEIQSDLKDLRAVETPWQEMQRNASRNIEEIQNILSISESGLFDEDQSNKIEERAKSDARSYVDALQDYYDRNSEHLTPKQVGILGDMVSELRSVFEEDEGSDSEDDAEETNMDAIFEERQKRISSLNELRISRHEARFEDARTTSEKIEALEDTHTARMREIRRAYYNDAEMNHAEFTRKIEQQERDFNKTKQQLQTDQRVFELEMQSMLMEDGLDNPSDYDRHLDMLDSYYANRRQIIRESTDSEIEETRKLTELEIEESNRREQAEQQLQSRKRSLVSNFSSFAVNSAQAVGQAIDEESRAQFQIQKVASASQAIINGYLAYTKTLAQGGFLAKPLAISSLALSVAQAGKIMSQSYDSAKATGAQGGASYRGFDFGESQSSTMPGHTTGSPYQGSQNVGNDERSQVSQGFPDKVAMDINDGFGNLVAKGTLDLQSQGKDDLGYIKSDN